MKILAIYYTQSGQLAEIVKNFVSPIQDAEIEFIQFKPKNDFPFPWTDEVFYNTMPECVQEIPVELEEITFKHQKYDLIIFGYQPWFLSPSVPATSLLKSEEFKRIVKDTPVITVIGSRNMWLNSQESVKKMLLEAGGKLVGNVPLIDRTTNLVSAVTIVHWMLTGNKTRKYGFLPLPGVSDEDIKGVAKIGAILNNSLKQNKLDEFQKEVVKAGAVNINPNILFIEERAKKIFVMWAALIKKKEQKNGSRSFWVKFFKVYLLFALFGVSPILLTVYNLLVRPFTGASLKKKKEYFYRTELKNK
jgi:hypothetical protein